MARPIGTRPIPWLADKDPKRQQFFEEVKHKLDNLQGQTGGPGSTGGSGATLFDRVLTSTDIANKSITLLSAPLYPARTLVHLQTGIAQYANTDFYIDGNLLKWDGLAMELLVESGQRIHVTYQ